MVKISQLPVSAAATDSDLLVMVDAESSTTKQVTRDEFFTGEPLPDGIITPDQLELSPNEAYVVTNESTTSTTFTDVATTTDTVTVVVGNNGLLLVTISAWMNNNGANSTSVGFTLSGANTLAASDKYSAFLIGTTVESKSITFLITGLTPGSTTVKQKYKVSAGTGGFQHRHIAAVPL